MSLLEVSGLVAGYGPVQVLHGVDLSVDEGEVAVVLGANGAGKTTLLRALSGMVRRQGSVRIAGEELIRAPADRIVRHRLAHVPQGRGTIPELTVEENLVIGAFIRRDRSAMRRDVRSMFDLFPRLEERRKQSAGNLSGGEQQMLALARALMLSPRLLLLDEPSLGLAPIVVQQLFDTLAKINKSFGTTMLIVEQNANLALRIARRAFLIETGHIVAEGDADSLAADESVRRAYLGY